MHLDFRDAKMRKQKKNIYIYSDSNFKTNELIRDALTLEGKKQCSSEPNLSSSWRFGSPD